jgi:dephospho-CoA kinase
MSVNTPIISRLPSSARANPRVPRLTVAITGGIGAGKSTVTALLRQLGAVTVSADDLAREVVAPGSPGLAAIVARFGPGVLTADGALDRTSLARVVFADPQARADLEAITHPLIQRRFELLRAATPDDQILVYEIPLLVEAGRRADFDHVVVVEADPQVCLHRLQARGLSDQQARQRMDSQADPATRRALADTVIDNSGTPQALRAQVDQLWQDLQPAGPR